MTDQKISKYRQLADFTTHHPKLECFRDTALFGNDIEVFSTVEKSALDENAIVITIGLKSAGTVIAQEWKDVFMGDDDVIRNVTGVLDDMAIRIHQMVLWNGIMYLTRPTT